MVTINNFVESYDDVIVRVLVWSVVDRGFVPRLECCRSWVRASSRVL